MEDNSLPPSGLIRPKTESETLSSADENRPLSSFSSTPDPEQQYPLESLEVHSEGSRPVVSSADTYTGTIRSVPFSRRRATLVSLLITGMVLIITAGSLILVARKSPQDDKGAQSTIPTQDVNFGDAPNGIASELQGSEESLLVNGDVITRGTIKIKSGSFVSVLKNTPLTANQTISIPNASGQICLDSNNCASATQAQFTQLQTQINQIVIPDPGVTSLNDQAGAITIQGSVNRISVSTSNGAVTVSTPQDLDANANVQFNSLTVNPTGEIKSNLLSQTGAGNDITINAAGDNLLIVDGSRTFVLPAGGGATQTICTSQGNCGGGGATPVILAPGSAQVDATADASIFINDTGGGNLIQLQSGGVDRLVVAPSGNTTIGGSLTVSGLGSGIVRSTGGLLSVGAVNLATEVTGTLAVTNGGTGAASLTANGVLVGNGTSAITSVVSGGAGLCLMSNVGAPSWQACPGGGGVTTVNSMAGAIAIQGTTNQINVASGAGLITLSTPQDIATTSSPTFAGLTSPTLQSTGALTLSSNAGGDITLNSADQLILTTAGGIETTSYFHSTNAIDIDGNSVIGGGSSLLASIPSSGNTLVVTDTFNGADDCTFGCAAVSAFAEKGTAPAIFLDAFRGQVGVAATQTVQNGSGLFIEGASVGGGGSITNAYGVYVASQTAGVNNYGIYVQNAGTYAIWVDAGLVRFDGGMILEGGNPIELEGATNDAFETTLGLIDPTVDRSIIFPDLSGTVCLSSGNCVGGSGSAPNSANYLVTALDGTLTNERAILAGSNIAFTDGGANGSFTVATVQNPSFTTSVTTPLLTSSGALSITSTAAVISIDSGNGQINLQDTTNITGGLTVSGDVDLGAHVAVGDSASVSVVAGLAVSETYTVADACAAFGCHGALVTSIANNVTTGGITGLFSATSTSAGAFTLQQAAGLVVGTTGLGAGSTITDNYGLYVQNQSAGATDYGIYINGADNYALFVNAGLSHFGGNLEFEGVTQDASEFTITVADPTADRTYTIPNSSVATDTFCLVTLGNCAGSGGGVTGSGTNNRVAKFTSTGSTIGDSTISDDGTNASLTGDLTIQGGDATVGTTSQVGSIILNDGSSNTATITAGAFGGNRVYTLPDVGGNADICLNTGNCAGTGGGITGTGTNNTLAKFTGSGTIGNASITDNGTTVAVGAALNVSGNTDLAGTLFVGTADAFQVSSSGAVTAVGINAGGAITGVTTLTASGTINTTGGVLQTNSTTRVDNAGNLTNIGNITGTGAVTIASSGGGDVVVDGADEFIVQDAAVFNAQTSFNSDVDVVLADSENWSVSSTITGATSVSVLNMVVTNNTSSGTQNLALLQNAAGSGTTDGLLVLDNADTDTAVSGAIVVTSAAGGITNGIDVSDIDIVNALLFGTNDVIGTNFTIAGATGATTIGSAIQQGALTLHDGNGETATLSVGSALAANTALAIPTGVGASDTFCLETLANCSGGSSAPTNAEYLVVSLNGTLTDERALAAGNNISFTDGGAGAGFTVATTQNPTFTTSVTTPLLQSSAGMQITSTGTIDITAGNTITIGSTGETLNLQGADTNISSNGATNDITLTSADQIVLSSAGTIELQNSTNITGNLVATGTGTFQGASVTVGAAAQQGSLRLSDGSSNTGIIQTAALGQDTTYTLIDPGTASVNICLSTGNCAGSGTGVTASTPGTANRIAVFTAGQNIANSWLLQNSSTLELDNTRNLSLLGGNLDVTGSGTFSGDVAVNGGDVTSTSTLTLQSATTNAITLDSGTSGAVNIGTNNNGKTIQIGSVTLSSGTQTIGIGNNNTAGGTTNVTIGTGTTATAGTTTIQSKGVLTVTGTGGITATGAAASSLTTSAGALTLTAAAASTWSTSSGNLSLQAAGTLNIGLAGGTAINIGTNNAAHTIAIGNAGATGTQAITVGGSGNVNNSLTLQGGSTGGISIGAATTPVNFNSTNMFIPNNLDIQSTESILFVGGAGGASNRKVGIGTNAPGARLHIVQKADGIGEGLRVKDSGSNAAVNIYYTNPGALAFIDVASTYQMGHITSLPQNGQLNAGRVLTLKSFNESSLGGISFDIGGTEIARLNTNNQLVLSDGAVGTPAFSFLNDLNTGMYRAGTDDLRLSAGGQSQLRATVNGVFIEERLVLGVDARTIASTGDGSPATLTLNPNSSYVEITCNDPDTCDITMDEAAPVAGGQAVYIVNVSANIVDFADTAGVTELAGACAASQYDTISMLYVDATVLRWIELSRSNNSGVGGCA